MRRILYFVLSTVSAVVLLFSYRTSTAAVTPGAATVVVAAPTTGQGTTTTSTAAGQEPVVTVPDDTASATTTDSTDTTANASGLADGTWTGSAADTRYGPVQVQITVAAGQITAATAVDYPNTDRKDQQINDRAIPVLNSEAVSAQSSSIDSVSGATYTSDGYQTSLQSAIDQARS